MLGSSLTEIDGVGENTARALIKHFKTVAAIKAADIAELSAVSGVNKRAAKNVYDYFCGK